MMVSSDKNESLSEKVCDICGVSGFEDLIATCIKCTSSKHIYCLPITVKGVPSEWTCEECERDVNVSSLTSREVVDQNSLQCAGCGQVSDSSRKQGWFKKQKTVETAKVKFLSTEEAIMLSSGAQTRVFSSKPNMDSRFGPGRNRKSTNRSSVGFPSSFLEFPLMKLKENHGIRPSGQSKPPRFCQTQTCLTSKQQAPQISKELDGKKAFAAPAKERVCRKELVAVDVSTHAREVETSNPRAEIEIKEASTLPSVQVSGGTYHSDAELMNSDKGTVPPIIPPKLDNIPGKCAAIEAVWRGRFKFVDNATPDESYVGFQAHTPYIVHRKIYEFSKQMPAILEFEKLPRCSVWVELFQDEPPDGDDISLYFFPGGFGRSRRGYTDLLKLMETQDLAMRGHMDGVELLLFTSKQMHTDCQRIGAQYYLWGVLRCVKTKGIVVPPLEYLGDYNKTRDDHSNKDNGEVVDMEIDMIGGETVGEVNAAVGKVIKEEYNNCVDSFPGFTVKVDNRFASAEPFGSPHTYSDVPPGFEEVWLKSSGNSSTPTFKGILGLSGINTTIKLEDTSTKNVSVGVMASRSLPFQTASWRSPQVPALKLPLPEKQTRNNPLHSSGLGKRSPRTPKQEKAETSGWRKWSEVDERKQEEKVETSGWRRWSEAGERKQGAFRRL